MDDNNAPGPPPRQTEAKRSIRYITQAVLEFGHVHGLADLLDRVAYLCLVTRCSPYNALLILLQRPAATFVLPAHQWQERFGYVVRPGEQPMVLLQPGGPVMFLLDVTQVEAGPGALPLPLDLANPYAMADAPRADEAVHWITENAKYDGLRVSPSPLGQGFSGCVQRTRAAAAQPIEVRRRPETVVEQVPVLFDVELNRSYSPTEQLATLAHELGHVYCGHLDVGRTDHWKDRSSLSPEWRELEAESVARVVSRSLAPEMPLPRHLHQYFDRARSIRSQPGGGAEGGRSRAADLSRLESAVGHRIAYKLNLSVDLCEPFRICTQLIPLQKGTDHVHHDRRAHGRPSRRRRGVPGCTRRRSPQHHSRDT